MSHAVTYPLYQNLSGWNALLPARNAAPKTAPATHYDAVVIGAGYTGLAAARRLAELDPQSSILVAEASVVGEGSSARNSGFVISLPHNTKMAGHTSPTEVAQKQIRLYGAGVDWLKRTVDENNIECGWNPIGKYHAAATQEGMHSLQSALAQYKEWGIGHTELSPSELQEKIGTSYYRYGFHTGHSVFVQPAALIRGLADTLPANVALLENAPVVSISGRGPYTVAMRDRTVTAKTVVLANNGFAKKLGFFKDRLITIYTYAAMTPELDDAQLALHGPAAEWGLIPANRLGTTLRKIQNRRFMVRSAYSYEHAQPLAEIEAMLVDCYRRRYPGLKSHRLEYVWGGVTALTRNGATFFGKAKTGLYASVGCNGAGVLKGSMYGKLLAEMIMGSQSRELSDALSLEAPSWLPPEPLRRLAVTAAIRRQKIKAGLEF